MVALQSGYSLAYVTCAMVPSSVLGSTPNDHAVSLKGSRHVPTAIKRLVADMCTVISFSASVSNAIDVVEDLESFQDVIWSKDIIKHRAKLKRQRALIERRLRAARAKKKPAQNLVLPFKKENSRTKRHGQKYPRVISPSVKSRTENLKTFVKFDKKPPRSHDAARGGTDKQPRKPRPSSANCRRKIREAAIWRHVPQPIQVPVRPSTATSRKKSRVKSSSSNRRRKGSKDDSTFADVLKGKRAENARENVSPGLKTIKALNRKGTKTDRKPGVECTDGLSSVNAPKNSPISGRRPVSARAQTAPILHEDDRSHGTIPSEETAKHSGINTVEGQKIPDSRTLPREIFCGATLLRQSETGVGGRKIAFQTVAILEGNDEELDDRLNEYSVNSSTFSPVAAKKTPLFRRRINRSSVDDQMLDQSGDSSTMRDASGQSPWGTPKEGSKLVRPKSQSSTRRRRNPGLPGWNGPAGSSLHRRSVKDAKKQTYNFLPPSLARPFLKYAYNTRGGEPSFYKGNVRRKRSKKSQKMKQSSQNWHVETDFLLKRIEELHRKQHSTLKFEHGGRRGSYRESLRKKESSKKEN